MQIHRFSPSFGQTIEEIQKLMQQDEIDLKKLLKKIELFIYLKSDEAKENVIQLMSFPCDKQPA